MFAFLRNTFWKGSRVTLHGRTTMVSRVTTVVLGVFLLPLAFTCAISVSFLTISSAFAAQDITPTVQYQNLTELFARKAYANSKPTALLYTSGTRVFQPELCIFKDVQYGTEIWRIFNDPAEEEHHCHINRSPWNCNGSQLGIMSYRYVPGFTEKIMLVVNADGDSIRVVAPQGGTRLDNYQRHANWDKLNPGIMWFAYYDGLYKVDVRANDATNLFQALPRTSRRKVIFTNTSETNQIMVMDYTADLGPSDTAYAYMVDPQASGATRYVTYPLRFDITWPGHDKAQEYHIHDIYFRRGADTTYVFNYGSPSSVGEALFFEAPYCGDKSKVRICYPDVSHGVPYYSHPAWNHDGTKVAYVGESSPGANDYGIHVREHDTKTPLATLTTQVTSAHLAWDSYDDEWVFGSATWSDGLGKILKMRTVNPICLPFVNPYTNINGSSGTYCSDTRPAQSPDATKVLYTSSMLHSDDKPSVYIAVARYPYPPRNLSAVGSSNVIISWQPHPISREVKGYHVYRSTNSDNAFVELTTTAVGATNYTDNAVQLGTIYYYAVTSEEFSDLESDILSEILKVDVQQGGTRSSIYKPEGQKGWDTTPPAPVSGVTIQQVASGQHRLNWLGSTEKDVRYYNIYYSVQGPPSATQERRIASTPRGTTTYLDWLARTDASPYYAVTAVDRAGNESAPTSPGPGEPDTTPPGPVRDLQ